jgi:amidase
MDGDPDPPVGTKDISRRGFLGAAGMVLFAAPQQGIVAASAPCHISTSTPSRRSTRFEFEELSIRELQTGMESGRWTARAVVAGCLGRIAALDRQGVTLRHVLETNPEALAIADDLDRERRAGRVRGPLHGIPVLLKDNIDTSDQMTTTAGSLALEGSHAPRDAFLAERLRDAGAVLLAKTSMSEWANFRSPRSSSGWCSRGGQGRNPYALDRTPCGSSSGTAGGIAASYAPAGIGTETDGSITCPASSMGLVGIKPTVGLVSRSGIIPISATQDTAGPICRSVEDATILLTALTGVDPRDPATRGSAGRSGFDYTRFLDVAGVHGKRLGVTRKVFTGYHDATDHLFEEALDVLRHLGATIVDPADLTHASDSGEAETEVLMYEFKAGVNAYLATLGPDAPVRSLEEVIAFNDRERDRVMPYFGQETLVASQAKGGLGSPGYRKALATCARLWRTEGIDRVMTRHRLDALVAPTGNPAWPIDLVNGDHFTGSVTTPAAVAGYPHVTVPAGSVLGLPVGLSFFGRAWSEPVLISLAFAFEQATQHRRTPTYLATIDPGPGGDGHVEAGG